jgi:protein-tyrosine kinase
MKGSTSKSIVDFQHAFNFPFQLLLNHLQQVSGEKVLGNLLWLGAAPEIGVTTLITEFAKYLTSRLNQRVLLVDANYSSPRLHRIFGVPLEPGFAEVLSGECGPEVIQSTSYSNLFLIPAGDKEHFPRRLGGDGGRVRETISNLRKENELMLLDTAPVVSSAESFYLASRVDGVIVVARSEKTRLQVLQATREQLEEAGASIVGAILNRRKYHIPGWIYQRLS